MTARIRAGGGASVAVPAAGETLVVFAQPSQVEAWYECPGLTVDHPDDAGQPNPRQVPLRGSCGFRAPWDDPAWVTDAAGDKRCPCGALPPLYPVGCNFQVDCCCEQDGCNASDCVESVARGDGCPLCGNREATLREIRVEPIRGRR